MSGTTIFDRIPFLSRKAQKTPSFGGSVVTPQQSVQTPAAAPAPLPSHALSPSTPSSTPSPSALQKPDDAVGHAATPISANTNLTLNVNDLDYTVSVPAEMPLLWVLRDVLGFTGTKFGCGFNVCGACMVLINDVGTLTCNLPVSTAVGSRIVTVEGLANDPVGQRVQQAWLDNQVPQCGYCQPGFLIEATAAVKAGKTGSLVLDELDHICVCGTYPRMVKAVAALSN